MREILSEAVAEPVTRPNLATAWLERFSALGGAELDVPPRSTPPRAAVFDP